MKKISLAVSDFAYPSPLVGSIDSQSGLGRSQQIGQEIHLRVQAERSAGFSNYKAEVALNHEFASENYWYP